MLLHAQSVLEMTLFNTHVNWQHQQQQKFQQYTVVLLPSLFQTADIAETSRLAKYLFMGVFNLFKLPTSFLNRLQYLSQ